MTLKGDEASSQVEASGGGGSAIFVGDRALGFVCDSGQQQLTTFHLYSIVVYIFLQHGICTYVISSIESCLFKSGFFLYAFEKTQP